MFKQYLPKTVGREKLVDKISLTKTGIFFGKFNPGKRLSIMYDSGTNTIKFVESDDYSYKVIKSGTSYLVNAYSFLHKNILPFGMYKKVGNLTYKFIEKTEEQL